MTATAPRLYTVEILGLATGLSQWPINPSMPLRGEARAVTCGSSLTLSLDTDLTGRIAALGIAAQACAIGQASAAIFAGAARGVSRAEISAAADEIEAWLAGTGGQPAWPGIQAIDAARAYPARHGAIMLAWRAALDALPMTASAS